MTVWTTNDENRYQRILSDAAFRAQCERDAEEKARRIRAAREQAEYAASKPDSKSRDVLAIAASWEQWVLRADDADEIEEAF